MNSTQLSVAEQIAFLREEIRRRPPKFAEMFCKEQLRYTASWLPRATLDYAARTEFADLIGNKYRLRVDPYTFPRMSVVEGRCPIDLVKRLHAIRGSGRRMKSLEAAAAQLIEELYYSDSNQPAYAKTGTLMTDNRFNWLVQQVLGIEQALRPVVDLDDPLFRARGNPDAGLQPDLSHLLKLLRDEQAEITHAIIEFLQSLLMRHEPYYLRFLDRQGPPIQIDRLAVAALYCRERQKIEIARMRKLRVLARKAGSNGIDVKKLRPLFRPAPTSSISDHKVAIRLISKQITVSEKQISRILQSDGVSLLWMEWRLRDYFHPENQFLQSNIPDISPPTVGQ